MKKSTSSPNLDHSQLSGNSNGISSRLIGGKKLCFLVLPSLISFSFSNLIFFSSAEAGSSLGSCSTSSPCTANCKIRSRIFGTAFGASMSKSKFSNKVSSFIVSFASRKVAKTPSFRPYILFYVSNNFIKSSLLGNSTKYFELSIGQPLADQFEDRLDKTA